MLAPGFTLAQLVVVRQKCGPEGEAACDPDQFPRLTALEGVASA
jgi:hypothetical protein